MMRAEWQKAMATRRANAEARRAYEASQKQLFSDERETPDGSRYVHFIFVILFC
jgi:hypothetical protein